MSILDKLTFNARVNFELYPAAVMGSRFENARVLGIFDKDTARTWIDPDATHANVYSSLPAGTPDNPDQYQWVKFELPNGKIQVFGLPWIKENTIESVQRGTLVITLENVSPKDMNTIRRSIEANGYRAASIELT